MQVIDFIKEHITAAAKLAMDNYREEQRFCAALPEAPVIPPLEFFAENGLGAAAVEGEELLGFLGVWNPWEPVFCTRNVRGVFSPLHAHGAVTADRVRIYQLMYQHAAEKWVKAGATSHAIALYAHDAAAHEAFFTYGFGMRCMDLIRPAEPLEGASVSGFSFAELPVSRHKELRELRKKLSEHLAQSPCFMVDTPEDTEKWISRKELEPPRVFAAEISGAVVGYMEISEEGENFASCAPKIWNICGAFCLPEYRGSRVMQSLLRYMISVLRAEGCISVGVDCESINPNALRFWSKHFSAYTHSLVRRIDENVLSR